MAFLERTGIHALDHGLPVMDSEQRQQYTQEVVMPSRAHADEVTRGLEEQGLQTLESARTERLPGFNNRDYNRHWLDFVSQLPSLSQVVACDGWQFSFGTLLELRAAMDRGILVNDEHGLAIDRARAQREVAQATAEASRHGVDFSKLRLVMSEEDLRSE